MPHAKSAPSIRILDQNGQPAVNGVPSATSQTVDVTVGKAGDVFVPDTVNISVGDTVRWTWFESGHSVTSGPPCVPDSQYCSPNDTNCFPGVTSDNGTVYTHTFSQSGTYAYHCIVHCIIGMTGVVNVSGGCAPSGWSAGGNLPSAGVRFAGAYFQANGKFYAMGGRDASDVEFTHPFEYDPVTNTWTTKSATYPDADTNNMACGVLADAGTPYIYCVGGSNFASQTGTGRVFRYDPISDTISAVAAPWPPGDSSILPGGFTRFNDKLYILGGFDIPNGVGTDQIWEFTPPSSWVQKSAHLPVPLGYLPTTTIGSLIYTGGGADITGGALTDTTNSFKYDPAADSISTITSIPRATSNTRAVNFNGKMWVLGGQFPTPSNEVDIYDPMLNSWSLGPPMLTPRRNAAMDADGTSRIWAAGGYDDTGVANNTTEVFCQSAGTPTPTPTATATTTVTATPTVTATATHTPTATPTATATATHTPSSTPTPTPSAPGSPSATPTATPTASPSITPRPIPTPRPRPTPPPRP
jgi:plastocyanin/N-acetylneuraminic acid mutarotase